MQTVADDLWQRTVALFEEAGFIQDLGLILKDAGKGWCETELIVADKHAQQDGFVHAGVQATMADHTGGAAGYTLVPPEKRVLTVEFKINLLRPAQGDLLRCRAQVLRPGRNVIVAESEVFARNDGAEKLCAKATVTLAAVDLSAR